MDGIGAQERKREPSRRLRRRRAKPTVLLLVANGRLGYRVLRCVAQLAGRIIVLGSAGESRWPTDGLRVSRFCSEYRQCLRDYGDERTVDQINAIAAEAGRLIVVPADLPTTWFLAKFRRAIHTTVAPVPSPAALRRLAGKDDFARFCAEAGLPHPETTVLPAAEALGRFLAERPQDRFVAKPLDGEDGWGVTRIRASDPSWNAIAYAPILVQAHVPGQDLCASALCENGKIAAFQAYRPVRRRRLGRRLRVAMEFFDSPALRALVARAAAHGRFGGLINFQARLTDAGEIVLIGCNPRPWRSMHLAMLAGANFVRYWLDPSAWPQAAADARLALAPGGLLSTAGAPLAHARHVLADPWYYLSVDWPQARGQSPHRVAHP